MANFRELRVWERAHDLTLRIYETTASFPREEMYGLTSQIRRSCTSIPTNVAEGYGRGGDPELARFLHIAMGSASELEYQLLLARDLNLLPVPNYENLAQDLNEVQRMLASFIQRLSQPATAKAKS
jgi:four helix bundle protein